MCGRYGLYDTENFNDRFKVAAKPEQIAPRFNAAPGQRLPVIIQNAETGKREVRIMKWGLVPHWANDEKIGYKMINARAEGVFDKPAWRGPVKHRRALIPANGFYEWQKLSDGTKQPFWIHPEDQPLFGFAGLYEIKRNEDGVSLETFTIVTTTPNKQMEPIHDRMPVILHEDSEGIWLDPSLDERGPLEELLKPYQNGKLDMHEVSTAVNVVKNDSEHLVVPINSR